MEKMKFNIEELSVMSKVIDGCGEVATANFINMLHEKWRNMTDDERPYFWDQMSALKEDLRAIAVKKARQ